jgi:excisionase family DNA binding protein
MDDELEAAAALPSDWLTNEQGAAYLRVSKDTLRRARQSGQLKYVIVGQRRVMYRRRWLDRWATLAVQVVLCIVLVAVFVFAGLLVGELTGFDSLDRARATAHTTPGSGGSTGAVWGTNDRGG